MHLPSTNLASERDGTPLENTWVPAPRRSPFRNPPDTLYVKIFQLGTLQN